MRGHCLKKNKVHELRKRFLVTVLILAVYMAGRSLLLYHVDPAACQRGEPDSQNIMISMISGDRYQYTLFALGVMPYITASMILWIFMAAKGEEFRTRFSPQRVERLTWALMVCLSVSYAVPRAEELVFLASDLAPEILKAIAAAEMAAGAVIIYKIADFNKEYGIGGQTPLILVNILDNLISTARKFPWEQLILPLILCLVMSVCILAMENMIIRVPVQRVSIHNSYADKSYLAFKLDLIGVMPVMFAVSFFMLPQMVINALLLFDGNNNVLQLARERLDLKDIVGTSVYLGIVFILSIVFSFLMLAPGQMAEQLQKGGDSIVGIYAGKKTKNYLRNKVLGLSIFSGCVLCLMMGTSLGLSLTGKIPAELALLPATAMILTGMLCNLYWEVKSYRRFDSYSFFI